MTMHQADIIRTPHSVAVFGANGHTGRFVVTELLRRGLKPIAIGRNAGRLAEAGFAERGVECREAATEDDEALDGALAGAAAVINCAGPFMATAEAVVRAALRAGIHYLDITAEQPSVQATFDRHEAAAAKAGVVVIPAMGFYGGLADLLVAALMGEWRDADTVEIRVALDSWLPTKGTRVTGEKNTSRRLSVSGGQLGPVHQPPAEKVSVLPAPFGRQTFVELPFSEVPLIVRHVRTRELHSYLSTTALRDVRDPSTPPPKAIDQTGRSAQRFAVEVIVTQGDLRRRILAQGQDIYAVTAPIICEAVQRILSGDIRDTGAKPPAAIFDAASFLQALGANLLIEAAETLLFPA
ncbi:saccharopine dehydrogenase NADP-binding domain-containing protein (plasmid) [Rhizobium bangladeshense]|uniref:saccharopine dehydrogenase family protein n=1 Tax=Rhizobium bangladeshense TaxID=1138189 RepID=UPI001A98F0F2|nr:saccharopine dehydrogenase NADP-binding domain-containing protein [Rhizobium bangladeshense]QSY97144.1 saccharopine dehydrogenase NADP-binding domain-containing protein [Rhizobium bangladeshense]